MFDNFGVDADGERAERSLAAVDRPAQLDDLRARMAAIPGRVGAEARTPRSAADVIAVPGGLGEVLPDGGLARGSVVGYTGGGYVLLGLLAAATGAGQSAAVVGAPQLGLLAFEEMGGDLARLAHPDPGPDPLSIVAVLVEGISIVVLAVDGAAPPSRSRAVLARVRSHRAVLVITGPGWMRPDVRVESRVAGYAGLGKGRGRLQAVHLDVLVTGRGAPRTVRLALTGSGGSGMCWTRQPDATLVPDPLTQRASAIESAVN
jgi:hypothetical protein